jgi:hypothetical protein
MTVPCSAHRAALYTGDVADLVQYVYGAGANSNGAQKSAVMFGLRAGAQPVPASVIWFENSLGYYYSPTRLRRVYFIQLYIL